MVKANILTGKYKGVWFGNVACRSNGYFCIKNQNKINVNYKYLKMVQRFDGYIYSFVVYV